MSAVSTNPLLNGSLAVEVVAQVGVAGQIVGNVDAVESVLQFVAGELDRGLEQGLNLLVDIGAGVAPGRAAEDRRAGVEGIEMPDVAGRDAVADGGRGAGGIGEQIAGAVEINLAAEQGAGHRGDAQVGEAALEFLDLPRDLGDAQPLLGEIVVGQQIDVGRDGQADRLDGVDQLDGLFADVEELRRSWTARRRRRAWRCCAGR
jgi:hypothetical protein